MTTSAKAILALVGAVVIGAAIWGGYYFPKFQVPAGQTTVNSTFITAKQAAIVFNPSTASATSTSILNPAGQDVYVTDGFVGCENATTSYTAVTGTGLATLLFKAATTSTAAPATVSNTNLVMNLIIATGTVASGVASNYGGIVLEATSSISTTTATGALVMPSSGSASATAFNFLWPASTYLTFWSNATNTAQCTIGVHYYSS